MFGEVYSILKLLPFILRISISTLLFRTDGRQHSTDTNVMHFFILFFPHGFVRLVASDLYACVNFTRQIEIKPSKH